MIVADEEFKELPHREPAWAALDRVTAYRKQLLASGYSPVPVNGKAIHLSDWQNIRATPAIIETWATTRADHLNTGVLCRDTPFVDIDVTVEEVAEEIEALFEDAIENSAVRIGQPPKRAIPFRTDEPFKKMAVQFKAPAGTLHKVEILGDGQQIVVAGIHPDTGQPYRWHGGEPGPKLRREDLPLLTAESAAVFLAAAAEVMRSHGWTEVEGKKSNGTDKNTSAGIARDHAGGDASTRERTYARATLDGCSKTSPQHRPATATIFFTRKVFVSAPWWRAAGSRAQKLKRHCSTVLRLAAWLPTMARHKPVRQSSPELMMALPCRVQIWTLKRATAKGGKTQPLLKKQLAVKRGR